MCSLCDRTVELIEQTNNAGGTGRRSWVEFSFPGGEPRLVEVIDDKEDEEDEATTNSLG